jgi:hypothetical protein
MEPAVGFEPTTDGLQNRCSTTELSWLPIMRDECSTFIRQNNAFGDRPEHLRNGPRTMAVSILERWLEYRSFKIFYSSGKGLISFFKS